MGAAADRSPRVFALDLGSTRLKAASLDTEGRLADLRAEPAPALTGVDPVRTGDPEELLERASRLLAGRDSPAEPVRLGLASQRSSFLLFERDGRPVTRFVSWQDRSAADWCRRQRDREPAIRARCGLPLSAHYAGPKVAALVERDPALGARLAAGELLFGTLETWLAYRWSDGRVHATDPTMAARTLLSDPRRGTWDAELAALFGLPPGALPAIAPTAGRELRLAPGLVWAASVADQASAALALAGDDQRAALVNLGTGGFVLRPTGPVLVDLAGYLAGPLAMRADGTIRYALEGTINGAGSAVDRFGASPTALPAHDPSPEAFALPDAAGVGAPWWRPEIGLTLSPAARALDPAGRRRTVLEGLVLRVRGILEDLARAPGAHDVQGAGHPQSRRGAAERVLLAGGLAREPFVAPALAAALQRPIELMREPEATLLGAARLAAGLDPCTPERGRIVRPPAHAAWLSAKYPRWRAWVESLLDG